MDLNALDALLKRYSAAETRIGANLHELNTNSTYEILRTDDLRGRTAAKLNKLLAQSGKLWDYFGHLQSTLSRARTLRGEGRVRGDDLKELKHLLTGQSVMLYEVDVPLNERALTQSATSDETITIEQLLARMRATYEPIRDGVAEVESILRNVLPRLNAAETTLAEAKKQAGELRVREPELSEAIRKVERMRRMSLDDPLAIPKNAADEMESQVRLAAGRIAEAKQDHDRLDGDLGAMAGLVAEVRTLRARAEAARQDALAKIASPRGLVRVPPESAIDGPNGLKEAAETVIDELNGPWQAQRQQVDAWLLRARRLREQLHRAEQTNSASLNKRDELRGLLTAYRAKMASVGRAEDLELREITDEAHNELFTTPTDLGRAEQLVRNIGNELTGQY